MMIVAVFGGSFDPIHKGHQEIVNKLLQLDIDRLFIVPTFINRFKKKYFLPPYIRYKFLKKLFRHHKITILDYELKTKTKIKIFINFLK